MICLTDNDIILKLAYCDLLSEAITAWGITLSDVFVLNSAVHVLLRPQKPGKGKVKPSEPEYERLRAFFDVVRLIDIAPPVDEQLAFNDVMGIDPGEAILFSAMGVYADCILATSDKRSLISLCRAGGEVCGRVRNRLKGRVVCFEQTILRTIDHVGFAPVLAKVVPARHCDTALRALFGSGLSATESGVREGLSSYIDDLRRQTLDILVR
ncbi:MAG TPA: hypothetical protein VMF69_15110 [Gemmataceae bacterium]|nr:hypothetical protein [Gemmataceae bacterium]